MNTQKLKRIIRNLRALAVEHPSPDLAAATMRLVRLLDRCERREFVAAQVADNQTLALIASI